MKPKQLKSPLTWDTRRVLVEDRVWYVPEYYTDYQSWVFPGWSDPLFFANQHPIIVEYCSGNGSWIVEKALHYPHVNWVAVEKRFDRVRKIWSKIHNHSLPNLIVICGQAATVTEHYFPHNSLAGAYINFPDPWPKERHAKHRLIQPSFITSLTRVLMPGAQITIVTDDHAYSAQVSAVLLSVDALVSRFADPYYISEWPGYGSSYFDQLWRKKGRVPRYHSYEKR